MNLNSSSLDNRRKSKDNISPKPSNPVLAKVNLSSKYGLLSSTKVVQNQDSVKNENNETDSQRLGKSSKQVLPPIINSSFNSDVDTSSNTINKIENLRII